MLNVTSLRFVPKVGRDPLFPTVLHDIVWCTALLLRFQEKLQRKLKLVVFVSKKLFARNVSRVSTGQITTKEREPTKCMLNLFIVSKQILTLVPSNLARMGGGLTIDSVPG